jgi:hypothetical protein
MRQALIVALIGLNVVLAAALLYGTTASPAYAQAFGQPQYLITTGHFTANQEVVYILDQKNEILLAWRYDPNTRRVGANLAGGRDIARDFAKDGK